MKGKRTWPPCVCPATVSATRGGTDGNTSGLCVIKTTGDRVQDRALAEIGGKALWTKELDRALLAGEVDACVHSMKDVETVRPEAIAIAAMLPRADVRDRLIGVETIDDLPHGAMVGTSSPRRAAQLAALRPDLAAVPLDDPFHVREADPRAGVFRIQNQSLEGKEQLVLVLHVEPDPEPPYVQP